MNEVKPLRLLELVELGEVGAIEEFARTYLPYAYRLALSILDDPAGADDVAQDTLLTALERLPSFRGEAAFTTWLYTITLNLCRKRLRKRRSRARLMRLLPQIFNMHAETQHPETEVQKVEADADLWRAIRRLTDLQREVIVLRYYHDLPIAKISRTTGVSDRTVRNRLRAALERLRFLLKER